MSEVKHTPGPWRWEPIGSCWLIGGPENAPETVMQVDRHGNTVPGEANARLIAAAPEMLEALKHMVAVSNWTTTIQSEEQYDAMIASAEAAIRKAKGE